MDVNSVKFLETTYQAMVTVVTFLAVASNIHWRAMILDTSSTIADSYQ